MPAGRPPAGPRIVEKLEAAPQAKRRLRTILETITGESTISDASARLGIRPARFYVIRDQAMQAAAERLLPRPSGRPRKQLTSEERRIREDPAARTTELLRSVFGATP